MRKLKGWKENGEDVSDLLETRNGKANGLGWNTVEIWYKDALGVEERVGSLYCGEPKPCEGFKMEIIEVEE